jgi:tripartite-type tricarboxylate transporter receptor subunit TctC
LTSILYQVLIALDAVALIDPGEVPGHAPARGLLRGALLAGALGLAGLAQAQEKSPWLLVQPLERATVADAVALHYAKLLPQYLGEKVSVHEASRAKGPQAVQWVVNAAPPQRTVILMTPMLGVQAHDEDEARGRDPSVLPVQLMLQRSWCLAAVGAPSLRDSGELVAWLRGLGRPVRVGVPVKGGLPGIWVRAMERRSGMKWQAQPYAWAATLAVKGLLAGQQDLLLDHCAEMMRTAAAGGESVRSRLQILAFAGDQAMPNLPSFSQWRLPPISSGWMAWFVPARMEPAERERVGRALHAIALRTDTRRLIQDLQLDPSTLSVEDSQALVENSIGDWKAVAAWLDSLPAASPAAQP